jgi:hypothetical protein
MKNLTSRTITLVRLDLSSLEYADEKGHFVSKGAKNSGERPKATANKPGSAANRVPA